MRILFVNERLGHFGGVEQNVALTAAALRARGHACFLAYGMRTGRDEATYAESFDGCYACADLAANASVADARAMPDILEKTTPHAIYVHKAPRIAPFTAFQGAVRVVRMVHDHDLCCPRSYKYYAWNGVICQHPAGWRCWLDAAFAARDRTSPFGIRWVSISQRIAEMRANWGLDALLAGSRFMRHELIQNGFPPERVHIVPPCVHDQKEPATPVPEAPNILYVGQFLRGKGVDLLLQALARLKTPFQARLAGVGNAETSLRRLCADLGLAHNVSFVGWLDNEGLNSLYQWAKIVAVPSRWAEPFGMVGIEAMQRGRPVVAFDVGGIPDWLTDGETGLLVRELDPACLAAAIETLLNDAPRAADMGRNAREHVARRFGFAQYVDSIERHLGAHDPCRSNLCGSA